MKMIEHKYAHVFRWIADAESVQYWDDLSQDWDLLSNNTTVLCNAYLGVDFKFRLAPKKILVNGVEVPAPEKVAPKAGVDYFLPCTEAQDMWIAYDWQNGFFDNQCLDRGLVYLNKEDAIARAKAMLITKEV